MVDMNGIIVSSNGKGKDEGDRMANDVNYMNGRAMKAMIEAVGNGHLIFSGDYVYGIDDKSLMCFGVHFGDECHSAADDSLYDYSYLSSLKKELKVGDVVVINDDSTMSVNARSYDLKLISPDNSATAESLYKAINRTLDIDTSSDISTVMMAPEAMERMAKLINGLGVDMKKSKVNMSFNGNATWTKVIICDVTGVMTKSSGTRRCYIRIAYAGMHDVGI